MRRRYPVYAVRLALLTLILVGCAPPVAGVLPPSPTATASPMPPSPTAAATPTPTVVASPTPVLSSPTPAVTPGSLVVTLGDVGKTITMHVGERFLLNLGLGGELEPYDWTAVPSDPSVLSRVPNVLTVRGSQGLYEAHKPGQTELTAAGEATCRRYSPPCEVPSRSFSVTIVVQP